jgi:hypothetical protein
MPRLIAWLRRREDLLLLALCCAVILPLGVLPGQDGNWDLRNYHFYNPYAWLHGRLDVDVAPAQVQTWLSPIWDTVAYALLRSRVPSRASTALLALPAALALYALLLVARRLSPIRARGWASVAIVAMGATGAASMPTIGTTMSDWHVTALIVAAVWLLLLAGDRARGGLHVVALAGLAGGAAAGFKLTAVPFTVGLAALTLVLRRGTRLASLAALGAGGIAGFLALYGAWGWELYRRFQNPFFPFFNDVFHGPLVHDLSYRDSRFIGKGLGHVLALPILLAREKAGLVVEWPIRELRIALGFAALALLAFGRSGSDPGERLRWRGILVLFTVSYVLWATAFGYMRYAGALELLAAAAIAVAVAALLQGRPVLRWIGLASVSALVVASTKWLDAGRVPHGPPPVEALAPKLPPRALVVMATLEPIAYVVPSLPPEVPVVSLVNNFMRTEEQPTLLQRLALRRVLEHEGPLLLLTKRGNEKELYFSGTVPAGGDLVFGMLEEMGLSPAMDRCLRIRTGLDGDDLALCDLERRRATR